MFEVSLADLQDDEVTFRKFRLIAEEVQGRHVLTNFHGMNLTTDKLRSMVKKWQVCRQRLGCGIVTSICGVLECNLEQSERSELILMPEKVGFCNLFGCSGKFQRK